MKKSLLSLVLFGSLGLSTFSYANNMENVFAKAKEQVEQKENSANSLNEINLRIGNLIKEYKNAIFEVKQLNLTQIQEDKQKEGVYAFRLDFNVSINDEFARNLIKEVELAHQIPHTDEEMGRKLVIFSLEDALDEDNYRNAAIKKGNYISVPRDFVNLTGVSGSPLDLLRRLKIKLKYNSSSDVKLDLVAHNPKNNEKVPSGFGSLVYDFLYYGSVDLYTIFYLTEESVKDIKDLKLIFNDA